MKEILNNILKNGEVKVKTEVAVSVDKDTALTLAVLLCCVVIFWGIVYWVVTKKLN